MPRPGFAVIGDGEPRPLIGLGVATAVRAGAATLLAVGINQPDRISPEHGRGVAEHVRARLTGEAPLSPA
jgi:hypothetical protein